MKNKASNLKEPCQTSRLLGYAGLIPFVALSAVFCIFPDSIYKDIVIFSLLAYGVTIVSFLGAIHWGLTMQQTTPNRFLLVWGVIPSLLGWISLLLGSVNGLLLLAATLWLCFAVDYKIYPKFGLQDWMSMRFVLTAVASTTIALSVIFST
jgi:hypothetical protein